MNYTEVKLYLKPDNEENREILTAQLSLNGFESFMYDDEFVCAYVAENKFNIKNIEAVIQNLSFLDIKYLITEIQDQKWNEKWTENYYKPIIFGEELAVFASFHKNLPKTKLKIEVDPKMAFGTGNHGTTYLIIEEILKTDVSGKTILDMGTGTGILAILSKMKGSAYTLAVDNDSNACINTSENILINKTPDIDVKEGDINVLKDEMFDVIYENIWKNTVKADLPVLEKHLKPGGTIITSGFYAKEAHEVVEAGENAGLTFVESRENNEWAIVIFKK